MKDDLMATGNKPQPKPFTLLLYHFIAFSNQIPCSNTLTSQPAVVNFIGGGDKHIENHIQ